MLTDRTQINALMDQASSGDDGAFGALASIVQHELFRLALAQGLQREDAAEATQEALMRAYSGRAGWRGGADAMAWLCGIVLNVVREQRRKQRRRQTVWLDWTTCEAPGEGGTDRLAGKNALDPEQLQYLMEAVDGLPPRQREAIACRYLRRMSIRETARAMGCAEGTVKSAVAAALDRLRSILEKDR
jgi:RNA polymerase sigma-70 factor (ECF subfamily)